MDLASSTTNIKKVRARPGAPPIEDNKPFWVPYELQTSMNGKDFKPYTGSQTSAWRQSLYRLSPNGFVKTPDTATYREAIGQMDFDGEFTASQLPARSQSQRVLKKHDAASFACHLRGNVPSRGIAKGDKDMCTLTWMLDPVPSTDIHPVSSTDVPDGTRYLRLEGKMLKTEPKDFTRPVSKRQSSANITSAGRGKNGPRQVRGLSNSFTDGTPATQKTQAPPPTVSESGLYVSAHFPPNASYPTGGLLPHAQEDEVTCSLPAGFDGQQGFVYSAKARTHPSQRSASDLGPPPFAAGGSQEPSSAQHPYGQAYFDPNTAWMDPNGGLPGALDMQTNNSLMQYGRQGCPPSGSEFPWQNWPPASAEQSQLPGEDTPSGFPDSYGNPGSSQYNQWPYQ